MSGTLLLLGCIYVQSQYTAKWLNSLPLMEDGMITHQSFGINGDCKNYLFRSANGKFGESGNYSKFTDAQLSISVSTNNAFGLINSFDTLIIPLPFYYNSLATRPFKQCNFTIRLKVSKWKSCNKKKGYKRVPFFGATKKLDNKYFHYLISVCPTRARQHTIKSNNNIDRGGILDSLYPSRLDLVEYDNINPLDLYFNIAITTNPQKKVLVLGTRVLFAIIASAILYKLT